ncbi:MAG: hypothetical protein JST94_12845 [Bacteroidetes bacterium]|nr:hypothetical protein [Bacteroidota bacterium]MBS1672315.1 hypothetical protein [Bacteroidota bacterium]
MENEFSPEESLRIIQSMIDKTKNNVANDAFYFLFWGWLILIICIMQYVLLVWVKYPQHYYAWGLLWVGVIYLVFKTAIKNKKQKQKVKTYVDDSMKYLWTGLGITFFILGWICALNEWKNCFSLFIMLYGVGTFVSGCFLKFKPFIIGGIIAWVIALIAATANYQNQLLLTCLALIISYIIPGYMLRYNYKNQNN